MLELVLVLPVLVLEGLMGSRLTGPRYERVRIQEKDPSP